MKDYCEIFEKAWGISITRFLIDKDDFIKFKNSYEDSRSGIDDQKMLEYFIGLKILSPFSKDDIFIDAACQDCKFNEYIEKTFGCKAYRQDLYYLQEGINGRDIGGDATNLPFPNASITKLALFNSFEHFEENKDIALILEAERVLKKAGKLLIVPLEIGESHFEESDAGWIDESGKKHLWGVGARFARTYDVKTFKSRILDNCKME